MIRNYGENWTLKQEFLNSLGVMDPGVAGDARQHLPRTRRACLPQWTAEPKQELGESDTQGTLVLIVVSLELK